MPANSQLPACPECEKLLKVSNESNVIGTFLDFFLLRQYTLCKVDDETGRYYPVHANIERLLAEYYKIDLDKVDQERRALLDAIRSQNGDF